jgi:cytochrome P450
MPEAAECPAGVPLTVDPPDHARYRALLAEDFTPRAAAMLESKLRTLAADLIDSFAQRGSCEFVEEFGRPFPAAAFLALFGLPSAEWKRFVELAATILHPGGKAAAAAAAQEEINVILADLIASRQKDPRDDLMSHVLQRPFGDQPSPPRAVAESIAHLLFEAGLDTMTMALGHFFLFLATNPAHRQRLRDDPGVTANAVEELLRANSFITLPRFVKEDTTFRGVFMKKGDHVWLPTACGSRDPHSWERHDEVNFDRLAHRHLIFGAGPHRCLGSHLARLELRVAIEEFNTRIPEYSVAANYVPDYHGGIGMGLDSLRLVWDTQ